MPTLSCGAGKLLIALAFLTCVCCVSVANANAAIANAASRYGLHGPDQAHDQTQRRLRSRTRLAVDEDDEERVAIGDVPGVAKLIYKLTSDKQTAANRLFRHLKLGDKAPNLFTNAKFRQWEKTVTKSFKTNPAAANAAMYATMKSQLGDEALAKLLATASEVSGTKSIATRFQRLQFDKWAESRKGAEDAFKIFGLSHGADDIFTRPEYRSWLSYVLKLNPNNQSDLKQLAKYFTMKESRDRGLGLGKLKWKVLVIAAGSTITLAEEGG